MTGLVATRPVLILMLSTVAVAVFGVLANLLLHHASLAIRILVTAAAALLAVVVVLGAIGAVTLVRAPFVLLREERDMTARLGSERDRLTEQQAAAEHARTAKAQLAQLMRSSIFAFEALRARLMDGTLPGASKAHEIQQIKDVQRTLLAAGQALPPTDERLRSALMRLGPEDGEDIIAGCERRAGELRLLLSEGQPWESWPL